MQWLLHCNTGCLREHKPSVPCSILLSNNFVIVKTYSKNIMGSTDLVYSKKVDLKVPVRLSFQGLSLFRDAEKSAKYSYFASIDTGHKLNIYKTFRRCLIVFWTTHVCSSYVLCLQGWQDVVLSISPIFTTERLIISL